MYLKLCYSVYPVFIIKEHQTICVKGYVQWDVQIKHVLL